MSSENPIISDSDYNGVRIIHDGFKYDDYRQPIVQYAYDIGGMDLVKLIECENGNRNPFAVGDNGHAFGLCQINDYRHSIPQEYFDDWGYQVRLCNEKRKSNTRFYGPDRLVNGEKCYKAVENRFTFLE